MLLAIDTCERSCGVALMGDDQSVIGQVQRVIERGHAEHLMPLIEDMMQGTNTAYADLSKIGVTTGPGSFTGVRVGLSVARGLGFALGVPVVGVSALQVLAHQYGPKGDNQWCHVALMGRGGQAFYQRFCSADGLWRDVSEPRLCFAADIKVEAENNPGDLVGSGAVLVTGEDGGWLIDPVYAALCTAPLTPTSNPPDPLYLRAADAVAARPVFPE